MSLVQHLADEDQLAGHLDGAFPMLNGMAAEVVNVAYRQRTLRPQTQQELPHYAQVGGIVGQRLADLVQPAPPYPALLGAARCQAYNLGDADRLAGSYPTHAGTGRGLWSRPTPSGWWTPVQPGQGAPVEVEERLVGLLYEHRDDVADLPGGRLQATHAERQLLAGYRLVDMLEGVYRGNSDLRELQQVADTGHVDVADELSRDVLGVLGHLRPTVREVRALAAGAPAFQPIGYAAPLFMPGWAEGDVLIGPDEAGGYTLLDIKTVTTCHHTSVLRWLRQLTAYALLDVADRWRIRRIGLWLPRQAQVLTWDITGALVADRDEWLVLQGRATDVLADAAAGDGADARAVLDPDSTRRVG